MITKTEGSNREDVAGAFERIKRVAGTIAEALQYRAGEGKFGVGWFAFRIFAEHLLIIW